MNNYSLKALAILNYSYKVVKNYFHNQRIGTIIKHIPGHGLAQKDSHKIKPIVKVSSLM